MADSILRLKVESQEYDNKLKQATNGLTRYVDECRKVGGTLEVVEKETLDYVRALGQMDTTSRTATGKLAEMKKTFTELSAQYKQMTDAEKQSPFGKALAASLDQLKGRIGESKEQLDDINKSINGGGGLTGALDAVAGKFGLSIDQITKFGGVVGVATTAVQVAKDAFFQSESGIDEWGRTVEGAKGAYSVFLDTLNNGNWSNFFQNLSAAIQGGRDLYDVFDRLGSIKSNNAAAIAITQKEIAELRLAKQQGENVDAKLKAATERLAALQKQSVSAGMAAGSQSAFQTIRNGVNSIGGAGVNDATIKYVVDKIMKGGQSEFDKYKRNYEILQQKGTRTTVIPIDDGMGGTVNKYQSSFDINLLTKEQQKQYAIAKAVTEGETRIQKGIAAYAQSVSEGTASAREAFKGNRYALQGAGGGGRSGGGKTINSPTYAPDSIAAQQALVQQLTKQWNEAGAEVRNQYVQPLVEAEEKLKEMKNEQALLKEQAQGRLNGVNLWQGDIDDIAGGPGKRPQFAGGIPEIGKGLETLPQHLSPLQEMNYELSRMKELLEYAPDTQAYQEELQKIADKEKEISQFKGESNMSDEAKDSEKAWQKTASAISQVGSALKMIEDPTAQVMSIIAEAIANIALTFSKSLKGTVTPWDWIAAAAAGTATMISTIAAIKQVAVGSYAQGGVIPGNSFSGDTQLAQVNAGETILTRAQTGILASQLENAGIQNLRLDTYVTGEQIRLVLNNNGRRTGKGEYVQFKG